MRLSPGPARLLPSYIPLPPGAGERHCHPSDSSLPSGSGAACHETEVRGSGDLKNG